MCLSLFIKGRPEKDRKESSVELTYGSPKLSFSSKILMRSMHFFIVSVATMLVDNADANKCYKVLNRPVGKGSFLLACTSGSVVVHVHVTKWQETHDVTLLPYRQYGTVRVPDLYCSCLMPARLLCDADSSNIN